MASRWFVHALLAAGCSFQHGFAGGPGPGDGGPQLDGRPDARPASDALATVDAQPDAPRIIQPCPSGYTLSDAGRPLSSYRSVTASASFTAAEADCENDAAAGQQPTHLIVLDDAAERTWAYSTTTSDQWAGESDRILEGTYAPVTDQLAFYANPNGNNPGLDCVIIKQTDTLAENCANGHPYLCECDGYAADPTHF